MISWESPDHRAAFLSWRNGCDYDKGVELNPLFEHANQEELAELFVSTRALLSVRDTSLFRFCITARNTFGGSTAKTDMLTATISPQSKHISFTALYQPLHSEQVLAPLEDVGEKTYEAPLDPVARYETFAFDHHGTLYEHGTAHTSVHDNLRQDDMGEDSMPTRGLYLAMRFAVQTEIEHNCPPPPRHRGA